MNNNRTLPFDLHDRQGNDEKSIPDKLYFRISEVSRITGLEPYVLRYWETEFKLIRPVRTQSRHRLYKRRDLHIILEIKRLLYEEQYTIAGAKKRLDEIIRAEKRDDTDVAGIDVKTALLSTLEELRALRRLLE